MSRITEGLKNLVLNTTGKTLTGETPLQLLKSYIYELTGKTVNGETFGEVFANFDAVSVCATAFAVTSGGVAVQDPTITVEDEDGETVLPGSGGTYALKIGSYTYTVEKEGYEAKTGTISIGYVDIVTGSKTVNVALTEAETED